MKIVVLEGSPHKNGSSNLLAAQFITGANENGHSVTVLDAAFGKTSQSGTDNGGLGFQRRRNAVHGKTLPKTVPLYEFRERWNGAWHGLRNPLNDQRHKPYADGV